MGTKMLPSRDRLKKKSISSKTLEKTATKNILRNGKNASNKFSDLHTMFGTLS